MSGAAEDGQPVFRVVRGTPTPEELAALVGVLFAGTRVPVTVPAAPPSRWRSSGRPAAGLRPGPGAWRASALP